MSCCENRDRGVLTMITVRTRKHDEVVYTAFKNFAERFPQGYIHKKYGLEFRVDDIFDMYTELDDDFHYDYQYSNFWITSGDKIPVLLVTKLINELIGADDLGDWAIRAHYNQLIEKNRKNDMEFVGEIFYDRETNTYERLHYDREEFDLRFGRQKYQEPIKQWDMMESFRFESNRLARKIFGKF